MTSRTAPRGVPASQRSRFTIIVSAPQAAGSAAVADPARPVPMIKTSVVISAIVCRAFRSCRIGDRARQFAFGKDSSSI